MNSQTHHLATTKRITHSDTKNNLRMELVMRESGMIQARRMEEAFNFGSMAQFMRAIGKMIKRTVKVVSSMLMEMFTTVNGKMTKLMATDTIITPMAPSMKANGLKINNMARVKRFGPITLTMKEPTAMERSMGMVSSTGLMDLPTQETS